MAVLCGLLLWRFRQRVSGIALAAVVLAALAWLLGMSMFNVRSLRHYFFVGATLAILCACGMTGLLYAAQEALTRIGAAKRPGSLLMPAGLLALLAILLLPSYRESDALAHNFTLPDRRVELAHYMDSSLPPGKFITERAQPKTLHEPCARYLFDREWGNHKTFNRSWGGYAGVHDFPIAQDIKNLLSYPLETWRAMDAVYAIMPYSPLLKDPNVYYPDETVLLKSYLPDPNFRGPDMVVLRLYPMQNEAAGQLGPISLLGYDINSTQLQAGEELVFRHYWQADAPTPSPQHVFNHLLDAEGDIVTQADYVPLFDARRPTTTWDDPEEILLGREFTLALPPDLPAGEYQLVSGLYDPATWQRLISPDGRDRVEIAFITIS